MRIVQFRKNQPEENGSKNSYLGLQLPAREGMKVDGGDIVEISEPLVDLSGDSTSIDLIEKWDSVKETLERIQTECLANDSASLGEVDIVRIPISSVQILAPVTKPDKVICIGMNYVDHCAEQGVPPPKEPMVFSKFSSSIIGPYDDLRYPEVTEQLDWEVELAIVIGKTGKNVKKEEAMDYVFGYTTAHDVSARDWQLKRNGGQWLIGKTMDDFCPLGPALVTVDEIGDPHNLGLQTVVNGETKQDSNTRQLVFKTEELIAWLTRFFTLLPGDVILTGTPPGVGVFKKPQEFLKKGDVVECTIEKIGSVRNKIV